MPTALLCSRALNGTPVDGWGAAAALLAVAGGVLAGLGIDMDWGDAAFTHGLAAAAGSAGLYAAVNTVEARVVASAPSVGVGSAELRGALGVAGSAAAAVAAVATQEVGAAAALAREGSAGWAIMVGLLMLLYVGDFTAVSVLGPALLGAPGGPVILNISLLAGSILATLASVLFLGFRLTVPFSLGLVAVLSASALYVFKAEGGKAGEGPGQEYKPI